MKVLIATKEGQGKRKNDFSFTKEGELVKFGFECDNEIDGKCGCKRSVVGFDTFKATTTFKVVERNITKKKFIDRLSKSNKKAGWETKYSEELSKELLDIAKKFPLNSILEKRGKRIGVRK